MKKAILISIVFFLLATSTAQAKVLPQAKGGTKTVTKSNTTGGGITVTARLRADRKALIVNFGNLQNAKSVSYTLIYKTSGQQEGAGGTIATTSNTTSRELLFGTCSTNICRYHGNITDMRLEVNYTTKAGKKLLKRFKIRV